MSNLSKEQLTELTERVNERIAEWEFPRNFSGIIEKLPPGVVRLVADAIEEWQCANPLPMAELSSPGIGDTDMMDGYHIGWERGREALREELKQVTFDAEQARFAVEVEKLRADIAEMGKHWPSLEDQPNGADVFAGVHPVAGAPEPVTPEVAVQSAPDVIAPLPEPVVIPIVTNGNGHHAEPSPAAVAALGPEHTVVTPIVPRRQPRTLAEVDADTSEDVKTLRMGADERAAQLREIVGRLQDMADHGEMPSMAVWDERKPTHLPKADAITKRWDFSWGELAAYCHLKFTGKRVAKSIGR